jgi:glycerol-3-phosphate dehydrogenase
MTGATATGRRAAALARLGSERFDLLVVGAGATGAATARDAALRGLSVALVDAGDFAAETSSRSSKLIHGGLRYLQYGDLALVFEGLAERAHLMRTAPHLCRSVEFLFPGYRGESPRLATLGLGVALYNALALWRPPAARRMVSAGEMYALAPALRSAGLEGACGYVDCQTDDARLVLENVLDAETAGAAVANHVRAGRLLHDRQGRATGAVLADAETGARFNARARVVVSATGPFTDGFLEGVLGAGRPRRLRPTLGVHLVFDAARLPHGDRVLVLRTPGDNRLYFVMPAGARTIVGTTDTDWAPAGDPAAPPRLGDDLRARGADVAYLLAALNHGFPSLALGPDDVVSTFAGLRPLLATSAHTPSETSREHDITRDPDGVLVVAGGKLTTARRMGQQATDKVVDLLRASGLEATVGPCTTATRPLPGGGPLPDGLAADAEVSAHLARTYGSRAAAVTTIAAEAPELAGRIDPALPYLWAEVVHAARAEGAREVADVLCRRVHLFRDARDQGLAAAPRTAALLGRELGWSPGHLTSSVDAFRADVERSRRWRDEQPIA